MIRWLSFVLLNCGVVDCVTAIVDLSLSVSVVCKGPMPSELGRCVQLRFLTMNENQLTGV